MNDDAPVAVDLFCGRGGWTKGLLAAGFRVIGVDLEPQPDYPSEAEFLQADIRDLDGARFHGAAVVVASPPCQGFSKASALVRRGDRPLPEDCRLIIEALRVIGEAEPEFWAVENVQGALGWFRPLMGEPTLRNNPWYVWGRFPGFVSLGDRFPKTAYMGFWKRASKRHRASLAAEVPSGLAGPFAVACMDALQPEVPVREL